MADTSPSTPVRERDWVEIVATVLLALAAVATAWSGYQASRWNGEQAKAAGQTNALRIEAARSQGLAVGETQVDIALYIQWVDAYANNEAELQDFYIERFRPEFKPAFEAWLATDPFTNPDAPLSPFKMPEYQLDATDDAERLDRAAARSAGAVQRDIQRSTNYVLAVVLFSVALFFAGMSTKLHGPSLRKALIGIAGVIMVTTIAWVATFPVTFSV